MSEAPRDATAAVSAPLTPRRPQGSDPDEVRDWFDLETIVSLPAPAASFAAAEAAAADYRRAARADNTRRAYRADVARFTDWCAAHGQTALAGDRPRPSPHFSRRRRARASPSTPFGCATPPCVTCTCSPAIRRRPRRRWCPPPSPASAGRTAGRCAKRPRWCSNRCAPRCEGSPTPCPGIATGP